MKKIDPSFALLGLALAIGAFARFWNLTGHSLFIDEGFTFMVAGKPWPEMMNQIVYHDFHPPLFYVITHALIGWLHWPFWNYRYLTAPFGLVTIVATWAIARRLFGDAAAGVAAIVVAVEPSLIEWDRLFRMYSVMTALAALSWWLLLVAKEKTGRARWIFWTLYGVVAVLQPYVQYLGALNVLCQGLYALTDRRKMWPVFVCGAAAVAALLPWMWALRIQYPNGGHVAGTPTLPIYWWGIARNTIVSGLPVAWARLSWFDRVFTAVTIAFAAIGIYRGRKTILPYWLGVAALQIVFSLVMGKALIVPRYLLHVVPAIGIAVGAAVDGLLHTRARVLGLVLGFSVPAILSVSAANVLWDPYYQQPDWYLINLVVLQHERKDDAMLFVQGFPYVVAGDFTAFRHHDVAGPAMPSDLPYTFKWLQSHRNRRVWYIENQYFYPDPEKKIKAYLDKTRKIEGVWAESKASTGDVVNVVLYSEAATKLSRPPAQRNKGAHS
jgi:4-amino-4-deoxy-L-arabinose transferase-like glycosyltransferase